MGLEVNNNENEKACADKEAENMKNSMKKQLLAILPVYILQLCYGMSSGYPAITTPQLTMDCAQFSITRDQESWIVSIDNIATPVVCILSGFLQHNFGPKRILMLACFPYMCGWATAAVAAHFRSVYLLYVSRLFVGAGHGFIGTTIYTVEVSSREFRGSFSIFEGVLRSVGMILVYTCGAFLPWYQIAYWAPVFPLAAFLVLLHSPESPVYLVSKGRLEEAEESLKKLTHDNYDVSAKMKTISKAIENQEQQKRVNKMDYIKHFKSYPELYKPFFIVTVLSIVQQFSGATVIRGYVVKIFGNVFKKRAEHLISGNFTHLCVCDCEVGPPLSQSAYYSAIIIGIVRLFASLCLTKLLVSFRRRTLYAVSSCGTILSLSVFATILLLSDHIDSWRIDGSEDLLNWMSVVSACVLVFCVNLGVQPMPLLMSSELYPSELRAFCKGISRSFTCLLIVVSLKLFPLLEDGIHLYGSFYVYSGVVFLFFPFIMYILPETKDLSLSQINAQFVKQDITIEEWTVRSS